VLRGSIAVAALLLLVLGARALWRRLSFVPGPVPLVDGRLVLRPSPQFPLLLGIGALFPAGLIAVVTLRSWISEPDRLSTPIAGGLATVVVVAFSALQFVSAFRARLVVDDTGLERVGVVARRRVGWRDVARVVYNPSQRWFFVTSSRGARLWIPEDLRGIAQFADLALRRLPASVLDEDPNARDVLSELAGDGR
jgi:hypothetical protein